MPAMPDMAMGPNIEIDIDAKHIVELVDLDEQPSQYRDRRKDAMMLIWKFEVTNMTTGQVVVDLGSGDEWEMWGFSPDTTFRNETSGKVAKAREWTEALLGRQITDDEMKQLIQSGFKQGLLHKKAVADLEWYTNKNGAQNVGIIRLRPYKGTQAPAAARQPAAVGATSIPEDGVRYDQSGNEVHGETKEEKRARLQRELAAAEAE